MFLYRAACAPVPGCGKEDVVGTVMWDLEVGGFAKVAVGAARKTQSQVYPHATVEWKALLVPMFCLHPKQHSIASGTSQMATVSPSASET